jgi:hypothetical protein
LFVDVPSTEIKNSLTPTQWYLSTELVEERIQYNTSLVATMVRHVERTM